MTSLRLEPVGGRSVEGALACVASAVLARRPDGVFAEVAPGDVDRFIRALAFAGVAAAPCAIDLGPPPGMHAAIGRDLGSTTGIVPALDIVDVRRLRLGMATREILSRRWRALRPPSRAQRDRCRALLHGDDTVFSWHRRVWATRSALRTAASRSGLRPVVFDVDALTRPRHEGRALASEGAIARWLF